MSSSVILVHLRGLSRHLAGSPAAARRFIAEQELHPQSRRRTPPAAVAFFNQGLADELAGRVQTAIDLYTRPVRLSPGYAEVRIKLEKTSESAARSES